MKIKILFAFTLLSLAACRQETAINQNAQPNVSATATPNISVTDNGNLSNANNSAEKNVSQTAKPTPTATAAPKVSASPIVTPTASVSPSKYKNYTARGVIKQIDIENSSVTIDHEDIGDYMVAMQMPFPVVNKNILKNLQVGDKVSFVLETGVGVERIISIKKN